MKLSQPQIEQLYTFTQRHYVEWYDVQTELVDHLANGIEKQWKINPDLDFNEALNAEFKKFGVMGFSSVVDEKTAALNKYYRNQVWYYFKSFFKVPKIVITLFLIYIYYLGLTHLDNRFLLVVPTFVVLLFFPVKFLVESTKQVKRIERETNKKWLFNSTITQLGGLIHILNVGIYGSIFFDLDSAWSNTMNIIFSVAVVLLGMTLYTSIYIVTPSLKRKMEKQHPFCRSLK